MALLSMGLLLLVFVLGALAVLAGVSYLFFRWDKRIGVVWVLFLVAFAGWDVYRHLSFQAKCDEMVRALPEGTSAERVAEYLENNREYLEIIDLSNAQDGVFDDDGDDYGAIWVRFDTPPTITGLFSSQGGYCVFAFHFARNQSTGDMLVRSCGWTK